MSLYLDNGYVNIRWVLGLGLQFNYIVGGRGTGKTFTSLKTLIEDKLKFMLMRRTQTQADMISKPEFSPFKPINRMLNCNIGFVQLSKANAGICNLVDDGKKLVQDGEFLGYTCALSTISNMRGFDSSDCKVLLYDEFIPESHEKPIKNEGAAFSNAYETINRNRELDGFPPLQALCLANANNLSNPIFAEYGIVETAYNMVKRGTEVYINRDRSIGLFMLQDSPISKKKSETGLYKASANKKFKRMAISNVFDVNDENVSSRNLKEYVPILNIGNELTVYEHKSRNEYYVSEHLNHNCPYFGTDEVSLRRMFDRFNFLMAAYIDATIYFEKVLCEIKFKEYFKF